MTTTPTLPKALTRTASEFKDGWDLARLRGVDITPALRESLVEAGVHPERVEEYVDDLFARRDPTKRLDPKAYGERKIVPFGPR